MAVRKLTASSIENNIWYKSMLAGNAAYIPGAYDLLETTVLSSTAASVTFSNLGSYSSTYKHLQIRAVARTTTSWSSGNATLSINGSGMAHWHYLIGDGGNVTSGAAASSIALYTTADTATANSFAASILDIVDAYSSSKNKTVRTLTGFHAGGEYVVGLWSNLWNSTSSVTSLTITADTNFVSGCRFSLYGIK